MRPAVASLIWCFPLALGLISPPAAAEGTEAAKACVGISGDPARLACYDRAYGRPQPEKPTASPPPTPASAPGPASDAFGDNGQLPRDAKAKAALPKTVSNQVTRLSTLPNGLYRLALDNQQTWQTTQADFALSFKTGDTVIIERMLLGGYQISRAGDSRSVSVKRTQ
jgi:hypothetical protein